MTTATMTSGGGHASGIHPRRMLLLLGALPTLGITFFAFGVGLGIRGPDITMWALALTTAVVALLPLALDQGRPFTRRHLLLAVFCLSFMARISLPVFLKYIPGEDVKVPSGFTWTVIGPQDVIPAQIICLAGLVALLVGYALPLGRITSFIPTPRRDWSHVECLFAGSVAGAVGWLVFMTGQFGLLPTALGTGLFGTLAKGYANAVAIFTFARLRYRSRPALSILVVIVPITMGFAFFTGSKTAFFTAPAMVVLATLLEKGTIRARWIVLAVLALMSIYPLAAFHRNEVLQGNTLGAVDVLSRPDRTLTALSSFLSGAEADDYLRAGWEQTVSRLDGLGRTAVIIRDTPSMVPFQGGWSIGYIFLAYIPRVIWPDKPIITIGRWITTHYGPGPHMRSHTGPTWMGELYMNWGTAGVVLGMAVIGFLLRFAHEVLIVRSRTIPAMLVIIVLMFEIVTTLDGQIVGTVNGAVFTLGPILVLHLMMGMLFGRTTRSPAADGSSSPVPGATFPR